MQKSQFRDFAAVFPLGINPDECREVVGVLQLLYALFLYYCKGGAHHTISLFSLGHMLVTLCIHFAAGHPLYKMIEAIVCLVFCAGRYIILYLHHREVQMASRSRSARYRARV